MKPRHARFCVLAPLVLAAIASAPRDAHAQAWVGSKGSLDVSLDYNFGKSSETLADGGMTFPNSGMTSHQMTVGAEYAPMDKLAVDVSLPLLMLQYDGDQVYTHPGGGRYDDGNLHTTLTDLHAGARYQVLDGPIALSPMLGISVPVADYETVGNVVAGRHLAALHLGLAAGRQFGDFYAQAVYQFALVQKYDRTAETAKYGQNTSDANVVIGYTPIPRLDVNLGADLHLTHGGVDLSDLGTLAPDVALYHDGVLREQIFLVGGGVGYQITSTLGAHLAGRYFVSGRNTEKASVVALGLSWSPL